MKENKYDIIIKSRWIYGFVDKLFNKNGSNKICFNINLNSNDSFDPEEYAKYNEEKIREFKNKYDLTTADGIRSIPISEAKKYPDGGKSVVYMPEQILNRQATEYKKENKFDLAIECLKKANELYPYSFYAYQRNDYERLVDFLVLAKKFNEAKIVHNRLDLEVGTRLSELRKLQDYAKESGTESRKSYYDRIIKPNIDEERDREEYYWLLENFSNIAPKSFGGYRKMKKINSDNYKKIVQEVSLSGEFLDKISFWKNTK